MAVNFNGNLLPELSEQTGAFIRAIQYGDSLFETIRMLDAEMPFLDRHIHRLQNGMNLIGMEVPEIWDYSFFKTAIHQVATGNARIRLMVWRSPGGLYMPENHTPKFMVTAAPLGSPTFEWAEKPVVIGICKKVKLPVDEFSNIKTLNAPRYIQAGMEAQKNGWDDGVLLNQYGRICEATSSNIFWWEKDGTLCTPALTEGCVAGIMRDHVILMAKKHGIMIKTVESLPETLDTTPEIFLTNAIKGIVPAVYLGSNDGGGERTKTLYLEIFR